MSFDWLLLSALKCWCMYSVNLTVHMYTHIHFIQGLYLRTSIFLKCKFSPAMTSKGPPKIPLDWEQFRACQWIWEFYIYTKLRRTYLHGFENIIFIALSGGVLFTETQPLMTLLTWEALNADTLSTLFCPNAIELSIISTPEIRTPL